MVRKPALHTKPDVEETQRVGVSVNGEEKRTVIAGGWGTVSNQKSNNSRPEWLPLFQLLWETHQEFNSCLHQTSEWGINVTSVTLTMAWLLVPDDLVRAELWIFTQDSVKKHPVRNRLVWPDSFHFESWIWKLWHMSVPEKHQKIFWSQSDIEKHLLFPPTLYCTGTY